MPNRVRETLTAWAVSAGGKKKEKTGTESIG